MHEEKRGERVPCPVEIPTEPWGPHEMHDLAVEPQLDPVGAQQLALDAGEETGDEDRTTTARSSDGA